MLFSGFRSDGIPRQLLWQYFSVQVTKILTLGIGQTILKQHPSSFTGTDLDKHLKTLGIQKVVLVGELKLLYFTC